MLPKALKRCPKSNKSPNLVALIVTSSISQTLSSLKRGVIALFKITSPFNEKLLSCYKLNLMLKSEEN